MREVFVQLDPHASALKGERRNREIFLRGTGGERDGGANIVFGERREVGQDLGDACAFGETGEHSAEIDTRSPEHWLSAGDPGIVRDPLVIVQHYSILTPVMDRGSSASTCSEP